MPEDGPSGRATRMDLGAGYRAIRSFDGAGLPTQAFLLARMAVAPLGPLDAELRALSGRVLSLGCGHGLVERYLAYINPGVSIEGYDLDEKRVAQAAATAAACPRVRVHASDVRALRPERRFDAAIAIDVLHHVPAEDHRGIIAALRGWVKPGGILLVKEMATAPRRQYLWNRFHDRIVSGPGPIHCRSPEDMAEQVEAGEFEVTEVRRLRRLGMYPQYLVKAALPAQDTGESPGEGPPVT